MVQVDLEDGTMLDIRLQYPTGHGKSKVTELFRKASKSKKSDDHDELALQIEIQVAFVRACLMPGDDPTDDELAAVVAESGSWGGDLIRRCAQLCGMDSYQQYMAGDSKPAGR